MDINIIENTYTQTQNTVGSQSGKASTKTQDSVASQKEDKTKVATEAAVYEKSSDRQDGKSSSKKIYSKNQSERAAIVEQMKAQMNQRQQQLVDLVRDMISKQGSTYGKASDDDIWKFLANGNFEVDAETKAQAQADIADDGYWGVEQTSERILDFASALAGDDEEAMRKMQKAFEKGFKQATGAWGKELPDISQKTYDAVQKKFEEYFDSKKA